MATRDYQFIVGPETSTLPTATDPTGDEDIVNKGYADLNYAPKPNGYGGNQATVNDLKAVAVADRSNNQIRWLESADAFYYFDSASSATGDDDTVIEPDTGTGRWIKTAGGGGGGGGSSVQVERGEKLETNTACYLKVMSFLEFDSTNNKINFNEGSGELTATLSSAKYFLNNDENVAELTSDIKTQLEAVGGLTYTITFDAATRKFTIAGSGSFTLLWKTGANGSDNTDTHAGTELGYDDTSDTGSAASHVSDNEIDAQLDKNVFAFGTDADFIEKSNSYFGFDTSGGNKFSTATVQVNTSLATFSGLTDGDELFTASGTISIGASNNKIDFDEGAGELTATLTTADYVFPYDSLLTDIKTQMDTAGTDTYTVTFDRDDQTFTISSTGTFSLPINTGTNAANDALTTLGWDDADDASASSHTSDNSINKRGRIVNSQSAIGNSYPVGFAVSSDTVYAKRAEGIRYQEVVNKPNSFLAEPVDSDEGEEIILLSQHENASGQGVQLYLTITSPATFKFKYKTSPTGAWIDSTTTISLKDSGSTSRSEDFGGVGELNRISKVFMDEYGVAVAALRREDSGSTANEIWAFQSEDGGNTWTDGTVLETSSSVVQDLYVREKKAVIVWAVTAGSNTTFAISDDVGTGYDTWGTPVNTGDNLITAQRPVWCFIQYFPNETGINKHRIVIAGQDAGGAPNPPLVAYAKGDGSSVVNAQEPFGSTTRALWSAGIDKKGTGNRIILIANDGGSSASTQEAESNEDYNGGTLTWDNHTLQNINSGASPVDDQNGWNSANLRSWHNSMHQRALIVGDAAFAIIQDESNPSSEINAKLAYTWDITSGSWETPVQVGFSSGNHAQVNMQWLAGASGLLIAFHYNTNGRASSETNGQIWARFIQVDFDQQTLTLQALEQIDGGETMAGDQRWVWSSASIDSANISWERYDSGDTYDHIMTNRFI